MNAVTLDNLDSAAVHVLRRLLRGEKVDAQPFDRVPLLRDSREQLLRPGLVVEQVKGKQTTFAITAAGKALAPAISARDADITAANKARLDAEIAADRMRALAPALLAALTELVAAVMQPDLDDPAEAGVAAWKRHDEAVAVAQVAIIEAVGPTQ